MRSLKKNKQKLYYATYSDEIPVYETDEDGKIKYTEVDGELVPIPIGIMAGYNKPVIFYANIASMALISAHIRQFYLHRINPCLLRKRAGFGTRESHSTMRTVQLTGTAQTILSWLTNRL